MGRRDPVSPPFDKVIETRQRHRSRRPREGVDTRGRPCRAGPQGRACSPVGSTEILPAQAIAAHARAAIAPPTGSDASTAPVTPRASYLLELAVHAITSTL